MLSGHIWHLREGLLKGFMDKAEKAKQARRNRGRGKRNEKVLAKLMGMERVGIFGGEDGKDEMFSVEWKSRKKFIGKGWMEQALTNCPEGKTPLVVVHVTNERRMNDLVMVRLSDWLDLHGSLKEEERND